MDRATNWDVLQSQAVASFDRCTFTTGDGLADGHAVSCQDVMVLTGVVFDAGNTSGTVGVVFYLFDSGSFASFEAEVN